MVNFEICTQKYENSKNFYSRNKFSQGAAYYVKVEA